MDKNQIYMEHLKIEEVPWHRLTTPYGRAAGFPEYFEVMRDMTDMDAVKEVFNEIATNIEHQSTLWHSTPFAMIPLIRIFERGVSEADKNEVASFLVVKLLELFKVIAECYHDGDEMKHAEQLPEFSDMLKEEYLWSEEYDEEQDELRYEEEDVFPDDLFYSFYYYSYQVLLLCKPVLAALEGSCFQTKAKKLEELLYI